MKKLVMAFLAVSLAFSPLTYNVPAVTAQTTEPCVEVSAPDPIEFEARIGRFTNLMATFQWREISPGVWQLFMDINPVGGQEDWVSSYPNGWDRLFRRPVELPQTITEVDCPEPQEEVELEISNICTATNHKMYSVTNTNSTAIQFEVWVNGEYALNSAIGANNTNPSLRVEPAGVTSFRYTINGAETQETVVDSGVTCEDDTPTPTPSPTPSPTVTPSPAPQSHDARLTFNCSNKQWNVEVILRRHNAPVTNAVVEYEYYGKKDNRRTDGSGVNNFPFADEGKGVLKVYPETFPGTEITLDPPSCDPNSGEPQSAIVRGRVLGASTTFANTGSAEMIKNQIAFVCAVIASAVALKLTRTAKHA